MNRSTAVEFSRVHFSYNEGKDWAIEDAHLKIKQGDFVGIIGPNGAGKSTFVKLMLGFYQPSSGAIKLFGKSPEFASQRKRVGYVPQFKSFRQDLPMTVREMVLMGSTKFSLFYRPSKKDSETCEKLLSEFDCSELANVSVGELSGGELQRCLLARALIQDPDLLVLDEPTASIDPTGEKNIFDHLHKFKGQKTIFVVSHDFHFISSYIDTLICVSRKVYLHDSLEMGQLELDALYGHHVHQVRHDHEH